VHAHHRGIAHHIVQLVALERGDDQVQAHARLGRRRHGRPQLHGRVMTRYLGHLSRPDAPAPVKYLNGRPDTESQHPRQVRGLIVRERSPACGVTGR